MSNGKSEHSSDLGLARSIARRLRGPSTKGRPHSGPPRGPRYVRFDARRFESQAKSGSLPPPPDGEDQWGSDNWNQFLDDCLAVCHGRNAFLLDDHGLVVSTRGTEDPEVLEVLGARLTVTFQQADRMSHRAEGASTVCIELDDGWLTGVKYAVSGAGPLIVGVMGDAPVFGDPRDEIVELLQRAVSAMG